jgi:hypothetical protein
MARDKPPHTRQTVRLTGIPDSQALMRCNNGAERDPNLAQHILYIQDIDVFDVCRESPKLSVLDPALATSAPPRPELDRHKENKDGDSLRLRARSSSAWCRKNRTLNFVVFPRRRGGEELG